MYPAYVKASQNRMKLLLLKCSVGNERRECTNSVKSHLKMFCMWEQRKHRLELSLRIAERHERMPAYLLDFVVKHVCQMVD